MHDGVNILCTRNIPEPLVQEAMEKGIRIRSRNFITVERLDSIEVQQEVEYASLLTATVVFTSANAVNFVNDLSGIQPPGWRIFCVGHATRDAVVECFGEELIAETADDAAGLAELIIEEAPEEVIFFCGNKRRHELPDVLIRNGIDVTEIVVYETVESPAKVDADFNGIMFFSPSAVKSFFSANKPGENVILFAIGETTAAEIKMYSNNKTVISPLPTADAVVKEVIEFFT